jgi:catechol 2,3-dioxygenase-like lactoylglutathione lyase family enzyme
MKLGYVLLYVPDVKRSADFYKRAFGLELAFMSETGSYAALKTGETTLGFVAQSFVREMLPGGFRPAQTDEAAPPFEVAFTTDDVAAAQDKAVAAGARRVMAPTKKPWGQTVAYVRDPDGNLVEICTPMG